MSFIKIATMTVLTTASLSFMESAQATVITPDQAIRVNFTYTGAPAPEVNGIYVSIKTDNYYPAPPTPLGAKFYATLYQGDSKIASTVLGDSPPFDPYLHSYDFISTSSTFNTSEPKFDLSTFFGGASGGSVLFSSNMNFNFEDIGLWSNFEVSFTKDFSSFSRTFGNEISYPYPTSYEIVSNPSTVPEPYSVAYMMLGLVVISFTSLSRKQS